MKKQIVLLGDGVALINGCAVVALFINADGLRKQDDSMLTAEDVWYSNTHGELFGVLGAIQAAENAINKYIDKLKGRKALMPAIKKSLKTGVCPKRFSKRISVNGEWATGIGRACAKHIWGDVPTL